MEKSSLREVLIFTRFIMIWGRSNSVIVAVATTTVSCWEDGTCSLIQPPPKKLLLLPSWSFVEHDGGNWLKKNHHEKSILACMCTYILLTLLLYHHVLNTHCWVIILVFSRLWIFEAQIAFLETVRILCQIAISIF